MIAANELRIGNIFKNGVIESIPLAGWNEDGFDVNLNAIAWCTLEDLEPIPLEPEILEKCGFVKINDTDFHKQLYKKENCDYYICLESNEMIKYGGSYGDYCEIGDVEIKYLHQLQNCYFVLTGNELEVIL